MSVVCAGCGEEIKEKGIEVRGQDGIVRCCHLGECHKKVWNGYIYERDNKNLDR